MRIYLAMGLFIALTTQSDAAPLKKRAIEGHTIEVLTGRDGQEQLRIDGKVRLAERFINLDTPVVVDGTTVVTGNASNGGNVCAGDLFVLTLPLNGPPRLDKPKDACAEFTKTVDGTRLLIDMPATAAGDGERWIWSRAALSGPQPLKFEPKAEGGWAALSAKTMDHPSQLLNFADTAQPLRDRFAVVWTDLVSMAFGPGDIKYSDGWAIASSCRAHACDVSALLVVANAETKTIYVAMANDPRTVTLSSPADQWPAPARADIAAFEKRWRPAPTLTSPPHAAADTSNAAAHSSISGQAQTGSWTYGVHPVLGLSAHLAIGDQAIGIACIPQEHPLSGNVASRRMTPALWPTATEPGGIVSIVNKPFGLGGSTTYVANKAGFVEERGGYCGLQMNLLRSARELIFIKTRDMKLEWVGRRNTMTVDQKGKDVVLISGSDVAKLSETMTIPLNGARAAIDRLIKACPAIARMRSIDCDSGD